jgi:hypothetical protein
VKNRRPVALEKEYGSEPIQVLTSPLRAVHPTEPWMTRYNELLRITKIATVK